MTRSRSCSLPRERPTRRRSRSRSRSRSHDRRLSKRSRNRSGSTDDRRRRSRSPSPHSGDNERQRRKHKKHSKKEKKNPKRHKHKTDKAVGEDLSAVPVAAVNQEDKVEQQKESETGPADARSFFEQLQKQEASKQPVGTVHARGLPAPVSTTAISTTDKWECSKAGCGHMNSKHAPSCNKCGAMKRLTEWR